MSHSIFHILNSNNLHHAYIIEGDRENILPELLTFLESKHDVSTRGNPDFWCREFDLFGINDAHNVRVLQSRKAVSEGHKFFIIAFTTITTEAQNALLKMLEEPTSNTHFFIITPMLKQLLPTVLSRAVVIRRGNEVYDAREEEKDKSAQKFLRASPQERLVLIRNIIDEKDKSAAQKFLNQLETALSQSEKPKERTAETMRSLEEVIRARGHLSTRGPSLKLIFEHLALYIPASR